MSNAAILLHPNAFDTHGGRILGRHSAGESFLRGFLRHADVDRLFLWNHTNRSSAEMQALVEGIEPVRRPITWLPFTRPPALAEAGVVQLPGPNLGDYAWGRSPFGASSYSICGLTHTTATARAMDSLAQLMIAPVESHDALICTSSAVRASVELQLAAVHDYLAREYGGPRRRAAPQRVTIPLGVNVDDFAPDPAQRKAWRARLDIPDDAVVALYVGRFNHREKMNPALMAQALEAAARRTDKALYWINSGWAETEADGAAYHDGARALCPSVHYREVDGRAPDARFAIWSAADFFISFSDNIQETYGLTPVEAMAAGLPSVVTDWNGYKDTVRHGEDGFRVPTVAPPPGQGADLAYWHAREWLGYVGYVAAASQATAIDLGEATSAISILIANADFRRKLGDQARRRAREVFDWSAIIPQYQALWGELNARREAAAPQPPLRDNPFRPDPFSLFGNYPTQHLAGTWRVTLGEAITPEAAQARLATPLAAVGAFNRPTPQEIAAIVELLATGGPTTVEALVATFAAGRRGPITRGLLWLARYGVVVLQPPD